jgi:protein-disulfide isomerase-like protein with CxxC motif
VALFCPLDGRSRPPLPPASPPDPRFAPVTVEVRQVTDPACSWSWSAEAELRRLEREFGAALAFRPVMGGLSRDYLAGGPDPGARGGSPPAIYSWLVQHWLEVSEETAAPLDPLLWARSPLRSTHPACMAVKAAAEQAADSGRAYLRRLREGILCLGRGLDTPDALAEEAVRAGLDVARFRSDLGSSAITEAFGADLEEARALAAEVPERERERGVARAPGGGERASFPSLVFVGADGERHAVFGYRPYEHYRRAAMAAGAVPARVEAPGVLEALRRFGRMTTAEVEAVCELPGPRAAAELWRLASELRVRVTRVLTGHLWEPG